MGGDGGESASLPDVSRKLFRGFDTPVFGNLYSNIRIQFVGS
jgi:hypothetical protein